MFLFSMCVSGSKCSYFVIVKIISIVSLNIWTVSNDSYKMVWCVNGLMDNAKAKKTLCKNYSVLKIVLKWYLLFWSQPQLVLNLFLFFANFQPQCSYKIVVIKKLPSMVSKWCCHFKSGKIAKQSIESHEFWRSEGYC